MLTYNDVAQLLGIPRPTLTRKILDYNKDAHNTGGTQIQPTFIERHPGYERHLFNKEAAEQIRQLLGTKPTARRGRPPKGETKS